jgi:iron complex outermembrane receptor protein
VPLDPLSSQTIEVVRGAATLRYGSQAIGGVVNTFNNRVPRREQSGLDGDAAAAYDSVSDTGEGSLSLDAGRGDVAFHLDGFARRASDYDTPLGLQANSFFVGSGYAGGGSYFFGDNNRIGLAGTHYQARYGIPADTTFISMRQNKGEFGSSLKFKTGALEGLNIDASYADYSHSEIDPATAQTLATFNNREWDARAEALFGAVGPLTGAAVGLQLQDRHFDALGEGADYLLPTHTQGLAGFVFVEAPVGKLQVQAAARIEGERIEGTPASGVATARDFVPASISAGFIYAINDHVRLGLTAASAARAPGQSELFARGPHDGPQTFETGDPNLSLERANSLEATARYTFATSGRIEASLWGAHFNDYIYGGLTGRTCNEAGACAFDGPGELKELNYAQQDATFWGVELKGSAPLAKIGGGDLSVEVLGDYVRATFADGSNVPRIQPGRFGGGLTWAAPKLEAGFLLLAVADQKEVGPAETPTDGYASLDAHLTFKPTDTWEFLVVGHNLTDALERNATSLNKDEVAMPGRDIRLVMRARF